MCTGYVSTLLIVNIRVCVKRHNGLQITHCSHSNIYIYIPHSLILTAHPCVLRVESRPERDLAFIPFFRCLKAFSKDWRLRPTRIIRINAGCATTGTSQTNEIITYFRVRYSEYLIGDGCAENQSHNERWKCPSNTSLYRPLCSPLILV